MSRLERRDAFKSLFLQKQRKQRDFDCLAQGFRITLEDGNISPLMHRWGDSGAAAVLRGVQVVHLVAVEEHLVKH